MNREFLKGLGLEDDAIDKIMKEHGKTVNPIKEKADKVEDLESQINDYQQQIADRDQQLTDLSKQAEGNEDLQKQIKDLQKANDDAQKEWQDKLNKQQFDFALEKSITGEKARNPKAVKALLDTESIKLDGDKLLGLEEQLTALKESDGYLFGEEKPPGLQGRQPHNSDPNQQTNQNAELQKQYDEAMKAGNMPLAVSLKNQLFNQNENGE
ncbi:phage scaffolding protein [Virgibacillus halodenitrificans]|uniref:Phage scaffolding protein n=1 Tax=Virgibacillus halodenitrificans TaxID=1482 RepID=A0ABR7VMZ8_VIRHA|nr:phage scaffolding protein [Virgibacillus halodenitrificans]MBD1223284.1 phage scaffolding protein [Virgibacillus halodenitrificans]